jgi:hypothetical protein
MHQRGHRVAEQVAGSSLAQLGVLDAAPDYKGQMIAAERLALRREEHGEVVRPSTPRTKTCSWGPRLGDELRTAFPDLLLQPCCGPRADGHVTVLAALALIDQDQPAVELQVVEFQPHDFETPHAG